MQAVPERALRPVPFSRYEWIALIGIVLVAALLRLALPGVVEFKQDEANLSLMARDMATGRSFPLRSIDSSVGIPQPPTSVYFFVPPYLLSSDPVFATQFTAFTNVLAVLIAYRVTRRYYGPTAAIVAAALFAASPWAVIFSRKLWPPDQLAFLTLLTLWAGLAGFVEGRRWGQLLFLPLLSFTGQNHYLNFVLIFPAAYLLWVGRDRLKREFWLSLPITLLVWLPFLLGPAFSALISSVRGGGGIFRAGSAPRPFGFSPEALANWWELLSGSGIGVWAGQRAELFVQGLSAVLAVIMPLWNAIPALAAAATFYLLIRAVRGQNITRPVDRTLIIWLVSTPLVFSFTWFPEFNDHYLIPAHAAPFIALGIGAAALIGALKQAAIRRGGIAVGAAALLIGVLSQQAVMHTLLDFVNTQATPGGFGTPLGYYMHARNLILRAEPKSILAKLDGQYIGYNDMTSVWNFLLYDVPTVRFLQDGIEVFPAESVMYLTDECTPIVDDPTRYMYFRYRPDIQTGLPEGCLQAIPLQDPAWSGLGYTPVETPVFANTAHVTHYRWQPETGCLSLAWRAERPATGPANDFFQVMAHFTDANGQTISGLQADGYFWNGRYWRSGDVIVRHLCSDAARDRAAEIGGVMIGLYTIEDSPTQGRLFHGIDVLDSNGTPIGRSFEIRLKR
jgi:4-amino-4-deoxy-L-arabinose transferase-like glycosyltransferase